MVLALLSGDGLVLYKKSTQVYRLGRSRFKSFNCLSLSFHKCKMGTVICMLRVTSGRRSLLSNRSLPSLLHLGPADLARSTE